MSLKRLAKLVLSFAWHLGAPFRPRRLTILYYHAVSASEADGFARQMAHLARHTALYWADHHGPIDPRRPAVAVTFDDAFRSVREHALPALQTSGVPATIFVPSGYMGSPPGWSMETGRDAHEVVMSAEELRSLPKELIRFGSHTVDHPRLSQLTADEIRKQLTESRKALEPALGVTIDTIAFPYGDHDSAVIAHSADAGYRQVYTVAPEAVDPLFPALVRGRTAVDPDDSMLEFYLKARGAYAWMPIASRIKRRLRRKAQPRPVPAYSPAG